jgi:hypothetical protein
VHAPSRTARDPQRTACGQSRQFAQKVGDEQSRQDHGLTTLRYRAGRRGKRQQHW